MLIKKKLAVLVCCGLFLSFLSTSALGAVFNVTDSAGFQTALTAAAGNTQNDTINVAAGTYDVASTLTYIANSLEPYTLTIQGAGADDTILKSNHEKIMSITAYEFVLIDGLTFLNGMASGSTDPDDSGAGLYARVSSAGLTVENCVFNGNYANRFGGGAYISNGSNPSGVVTFNNNVFMFNGASSSGGGLYVNPSPITYNPELILTNNLFLGNEAREYDGGGADVRAAGYTSAASIVERNTFLHNFAGRNGGGLCAELSSSAGASLYGGTVRNNLFLDNRAEEGGGGAYFEVNLVGTGKVINNTCIGNESDQGGGFYFWLREETEDDHDVTANIQNNIIGNNSAATGTDLYINNNFSGDYAGNATVYLYNNNYNESGYFVDGTPTVYATDNFDTNPNIVVWGDLATGSPCIDAGDSCGSPADDIHGETRPHNTLYDVGADEFCDADADGLPDYWETLTGETEPGDDPDGDDMDNLTEYERGLDPVVPAYDATGEWEVTITSVETDCSDMDIEDTTVTITQVEGNVTLEADEQTFEGVFNGPDSMYYVFNDETEEGETTKFRITFSLDTETSGSGTISWITTDDNDDNSLICNGSAEFTMEVPGEDDDDSCFINTVR